MSTTGENIAKIAEMLSDVLSGDLSSAGSLTRYSKTTSVVSRVYIEEDLVQEDIMVPLMNVLNQIYISYVMTALQLHNVIANYAVVRQAIQRVSTEGFVDVLDQIEDKFGEEDPALEAIKPIDIEKNVAHLATGRVIEFDFIVGKDDDKKPITVTVPIHVTLVPNQITSAVAEAFLSLNFTPTMSQRWKQVKAGEISLLRDFMLSRDLVDKYAKAIKEDDTNALKDMMSSKNAARRKQMLNAASGRVSNNIASSLLVFNKRGFDKAAHDANLNFKVYQDRQKFFEAALAMLVIVVDPMYESVDIYYNGLQQYSTLTNRMIESAGSKSNGVDMKELMGALAKGAPKF